MNRFLHLNKKLTLGLLLLLMVVFINIGISTAQAYGDIVTTEEPMNSAPVIFKPQVTIPGSTFQKGAEINLEPSTGPIARYISAIYNYGVGIVGILAALMLMLGGIVWLTAAGSSSKVEQAKSIIGSSLVGMTLVLTAYVLLKTINPDLVNLKTTAVTKLEELKCCQGPGVAAMTYPSFCTAKGSAYSVKSSEYVASIDKKSCVKGICCVTMVVDPSLSSIGGDQYESIKLKYKTSLPEECENATSFGLGLFTITQTTKFMVPKTCKQFQEEQCASNTSAPGTEDCFGKTGLGYCYGKVCADSQGGLMQGCGNDLGVCVKNTGSCPTNYEREYIGGVKCASGLRCCAPSDVFQNYVEDYCEDLADKSMSYLCPYSGVCNVGCKADLTQPKAPGCDQINCFIRDGNGHTKPANCPKVTVGGVTYDYGLPGSGVPGSTSRSVDIGIVKGNCEKMNFPMLTINRAGKYCQWDATQEKCVIDPD